MRLWTDLVWWPLSAPTVIFRVLSARERGAMCTAGEMRCERQGGRRTRGFRGRGRWGDTHEGDI